MRIFVDTANLDEIREWAEHPWVSGFTTNPTLVRNHGTTLTGMHWAEPAVAAANGLPISIDGPPEVKELGDNVWRKIVVDANGSFNANAREGSTGRTNWTAICCEGQIPYEVAGADIISVFAGRILDTGRDPFPIIRAARKTGARVLWASTREAYHIKLAEAFGCDIITCTPAILQKWLDQQGKPLETVAAETIAQFEKDREGLWD